MESFLSEQSGMSASETPLQASGSAEDTASDAKRPKKTPKSVFKRVATHMTGQSEKVSYSVCQQTVRVILSHGGSCMVY